MGPLRTLALFAALAVVLAELLPGAAMGLGWLVLPAFGLGLLGPVLAERISDRLTSNTPHALGLELAFVGLMGHQMTDGLQIGTAEALTEGGLVVGLAIAAHSAPLIAAAVFSTVGRLGAPTALRRLAWLTAATAVGVGLGHLAGAEWMSPITPWVQGIMAGLLLHILTHDLSSDPPQNLSQRVLDLAAVFLGVIGPVLLLDSHNHGHHPADHSHLNFPDALSALSLGLAPAALLVLVLVVGVRSTRQKQPVGDVLLSVFDAAAPWGVGLLLLVTWGAVWLPGLVGFVPESTPGLLGMGSVAVLAVLVLRGVWTVGVRGWFLPMSGEHDHEHGPSHDHSHEHAQY